MSKQGKELLRDLKLYTDYFKWNEDLDRYENWEEAVDDILDGHWKHYLAKGIDNSKINKYIDFVAPHMKERRVLASQRTLQFRGDQIAKHNAKVYNCVTTYIARNDVFQEAFYLGLCGCGVGWGLQVPMVQNLSKIAERTGPTKIHTVADSIEGWSDAAGVLLSSYFVDDQPFPEYAGCKVVFDYSEVRPKDSYINGGFKAPGPEGLRSSLEKIQVLLDSWLATHGDTFRPVLAYDILCHLSDAVLSGGVRRSAANAIIDYNDHEMIMAKTGDWFIENPQRGRSNNSVLLIRNKHSKEDFYSLYKLNQGMADIGFVFANTYFDMFNPCYEIAQIPFLVDKELLQVDYDDVYEVIKNNKDKLGVQGCNLSEINGELIKSEEDLMGATKAAAILGTLQAGYTSFSYLSDVSRQIFERENLLGVSITGWMNNPYLFEIPELLQKAAKYAIEVNQELAAILGINPAARVTCVKPSGNASVVLCTSPGANPLKSLLHFRIMQINKTATAAKYLMTHLPELLEDSVYSANQTDYVIYVPIEGTEDGLYTDEMNGLAHLEKVKYIQENWVLPGTVDELCVYKGINHNTSCTIIVSSEDRQAVADYIWDNRDSFTALSFTEPSVDKDYNQAPFTSVMSANQIVDTYGDAAILASGLIVDALHYFNEDLWTACTHVLDSDLEVTGTRSQVLLKKYWLARARKFARNYFKRDVKQMTYCLKDVHLFHKWLTISRILRPVDFTEVLTKPEYKNVGLYAAAACSGNSCDVTTIGSTNE